MSAQTISRQVQWQDLKVRGEIDVVFDIAAKQGWKDCDVFGYGEMITQPQEATGWKLIPADQYKYNIPIEAINRLHQVINAGVRVQGVIIVDDEHRAEPPRKPEKNKVSHLSAKKTMSWIGKALLRLIGTAIVLAFAGLIVASLVHLLLPVILFGMLACAVLDKQLDPKLIVLVDDGNGATAWVSLFTWYE